MFAIKNYTCFVHFQPTVHVHILYMTYALFVTTGECSDCYNNLKPRIQIAKVHIPIAKDGIECTCAHTSVLHA